MQTHSMVLVVCEITSGVDEVNHVDSIILCMMYYMWACGHVGGAPFWVVHHFDVV